MEPRKFRPDHVFVVFDTASETMIGAFHSEVQAKGVADLHDELFVKVYAVPMLTAIGTYDWEGGEDD